MIIFYNTQDRDRDEITKRCIIRLIEEGNSKEDIKSWIEAGVSHEDLNEFDYKGDCFSTKQLLEKYKVSYVIYFEDDGYVYIGTV